MEVETLSKTIVDEIEYTLAACDARYAVSDKEHLRKQAHYEVRVTRVDWEARGGDGQPWAGTTIGRVLFPFNAEGAQAARSTYAILIEVAHVPILRAAARPEPVTA